MAQHTSDVWLALLTIDHASLSNPIRLVNDKQSLTSNSNVYEPYAFEVTLPSDVEGGEPEAEITISNIVPQIMAAIRAIDGRPTVTMGIVMRSEPDAYQFGPHTYEFATAPWDARTIRFRVRLTEFARLAFPNASFGPADFPAMF